MSRVRRTTDRRAVTEAHARMAAAEAWLVRDWARPHRADYDAWGASSYPIQVRNVRAASAQATGGTWRDRAARLWRRAWLLRSVG